MLPTSDAHSIGSVGLFSGLKFWFAASVPQRRWLSEKATQHGAVVTPLERDADLKFFDHLRKPKPLCNEALSYAWVDDCLKEGFLVDQAAHRIYGRVEPVRPVGSSTAPAKGTRTKYTEEDDQTLWEWVTPYRIRGGQWGGNTIYQELEKVNGRHTWQSWRDRYLKVVSLQRRSSHTAQVRAVQDAILPSVVREEVRESDEFSRSSKRRRIAHTLDASDAQSNDTGKSTPKLREAPAVQPLTAQIQSQEEFHNSRDNSTVVSSLTLKNPLRPLSTDSHRSSTISQNNVFRGIDLIAHNITKQQVCELCKAIPHITNAPPEALPISWGQLASDGAWKGKTAKQWQDLFETQILPAFMRENGLRDTNELNRWAAAQRKKEEESEKAKLEIKIKQEELDCRNKSTGSPREASQEDENTEDLGSPEIGLTLPRGTKNNVQNGTASSTRSSPAVRETVPEVNCRTGGLYSRRSTPSRVSEIARKSPSQERSSTIPIVEPPIAQTNSTSSPRRHDNRISVQISPEAVRESQENKLQLVVDEANSQEIVTRMTILQPLNPRKGRDTVMAGDQKPVQHQSDAPTFSDKLRPQVIGPGKKRLFNRRLSQQNLNSQASPTSGQGVLSHQIPQVQESQAQMRFISSHDWSSDASQQQASTQAQQSFSNDNSSSALYIPNLDANGNMAGTPGHNSNTSGMVASSASDAPFVPGKRKSQLARAIGFVTAQSEKENGLSSSISVPSAQRPPESGQRQALGVSVTQSPSRTSLNTTQSTQDSRAPEIPETVLEVLHTSQDDQSDSGIEIEEEAPVPEVPESADVSLVSDHEDPAADESSPKPASDTNSECMLFETAQEMSEMWPPTQEQENQRSSNEDAQHGGIDDNEAEESDEESIESDHHDIPASVIRTNHAKARTAVDMLNALARPKEKIPVDRGRSISETGNAAVDTKQARVQIQAENASRSPRAQEVISTQPQILPSSGSSNHKSDRTEDQQDGEMPEEISAQNEIASQIEAESLGDDMIDDEQAKDGLEEPVIIPDRKREPDEQVKSRDSSTTDEEDVSFSEDELEPRIEVDRASSIDNLFEDAPIESIEVDEVVPVSKTRHSPAPARHGRARVAIIPPRARFSPSEPSDTQSRDSDAKETTVTRYDGYTKMSGNALKSPRRSEVSSTEVTALELDGEDELDVTLPLAKPDDLKRWLDREIRSYSKLKLTTTIIRRLAAAALNATLWNLPAASGVLMHMTTQAVDKHRKASDVTESEIDTLLPPELYGCWTLKDDKMLLSQRDEGIEAMEAKHGRDSCKRRIKHLRRQFGLS